MRVGDRIDVERLETIQVVYERLRLWLESGVEDDGMGMLFAGVRRRLSGITVDIGLLMDVAWRLWSLDG